MEEATNNIQESKQKLYFSIKEVAELESELDELNKHTHWGSKPNGFIGAFLLARELEDTRPQFIHFMNTVMVEKTPWFSLLISKEKWFPKN